MSPNDAPPGLPEPPRRAATLLESVEDLRAQLRAPAKPAEAPPAASAADDTVLFAPSLRPPVGMLCVLDDGGDDGEWFRIRKDQFVIGRAEGDLVLPHDGGISGRHAEVVRRPEGGRHRWYLRDLGSTNGTFVRASSSLLRHGQELLLGGTRLRFDDPGHGATEDTEVVGGSTAAPATTQRWQSVPRPDATRAPALVQLTPQGEGRRFSLGPGETWIGRDAGRCGVVLSDPQVSPRHARIAVDDQGRWTIHNNRARNGMWIRVREIGLDRGGHFQCGEQRFLFRCP